jgi:diguanylate cyclase (GGDEF)-like protein
MPRSGSNGSIDEDHDREDGLEITLIRARFRVTAHSHFDSASSTFNYSAFDRVEDVFWLIMKIIALPIVAMALVGGVTIWIVNGSILATAALFYPLRRKHRPWSAVATLVVAFLGSLAEQTAPMRSIFPELARAAWLPIPQAFSVIGIFAIALLGGWLITVASLIPVIGVVALEPTSWIALVVTLGLGVATGLLSREALIETARAKQNLLDLALTDPLTGLGNRRSLEEQYLRLQSIANQTHQPLMLSVWDVDLLKQVNDSHGHAKGDELLIHFAKVLTTCLDAESLVFRIGGDEFCCLHLGTREMSPVIERIRAQFASASVGFTVATSEPLETAIARADRLMYANKRQRRQTGEIHTPDSNSWYPDL